MSDRLAQVRSVYEAINRGDYAVIGELVEPGFEWHPTRASSTPPSAATPRTRSPGFATSSARG